MSIKKTMIIAALTSVLAFQTQAHPPEKREHPMHNLFKQLDLSVSQKQDLRSLMNQNRQDAGVYREDLESLHEELQALTQSDEFASATVTEIYARYQPILREMAKQKLETMQQVERILTSEQQQKMQELQAQRNEEGREDKFPERQEKILSKMRQRLDIGDEQTDVITALEDVLSKRHAVHETRRDFFKGLHEMELEGSVSEAGFELAFTQFYSELVTASLESVTATRDLFALLTDEQQQTLLEMAHKPPRHRD